MPLSIATLTPETGGSFNVPFGPLMVMTSAPIWQSTPLGRVIGFLATLDIKLSGDLPDSSSSLTIVPDRRSQSGAPCAAVFNYATRPITSPPRPLALACASVISPDEVEMIEM